MGILVQKIISWLQRNVAVTLVTDAIVKCNQLNIRFLFLMPENYKINVL